MDGFLLLIIPYEQLVKFILTIFFITTTFF
jgi:hypothetical protein